MDSSRDFPDIFEAKRSGSSLMATCPAHPDSTASLSISRGTAGDRWVIFCHAGCRVEDVLAEVGLTVGDLFDDPPKAKQRVVAEYSYTDEEGHLLTQVVRYAPKDFRQRRSDGNGGWQWRLGDVRRVLYRLPEVVAAIAAGRWVVIVEGEKDADRLATEGLVSTTGAGGAGSWREEYNDSLVGARVAIIADRDTAGRRHALDVAAKISSVVAELKVMEPPVDKDVTDWISAGGTADDVQRLILEAPAWPEHGLAINDEPPAPANRAADGDDAPAEKINQATILVRIALSHYRLAAADDGAPYAVPLHGPNVARPLRGGAASLRAELAAAYFAAHSRAPAQAASADALSVLEGQATAAPREPLALRVAEYAGGVVLDLGRTDGAAVVISPAGWGVVERSPVLFRRSALTGELPNPAPGGDLDALRGLLNISKAAWPLAVAWLVSALLPAIPHPIALLTGEQGAGKTSAARLLASIIDPSPAQVRAAPRDVEGWCVAASGSWIVAIDNLSTIADWLSDAMCRAVTGEGLARRQLYTDSGISVVSFRRPLVLTSIDLGALRGDLADRLLTAELERIPPDRRRTEQQLSAEFERLHPKILGALLDLTAQVLDVLPSVIAPNLPRMADFGRVLFALDEITGWDSAGTYAGQASRIALDLLAGDAVAAAIEALVKDDGDEWKGTATVLLDSITPDRPPRAWPATPSALSGKLRRLAPSLRVDGVTLEFSRQATGHRVITITRESPRPAVTSVTPDRKVPLTWENSTDGDGDETVTAASRPTALPSRVTATVTRPSRAFIASDLGEHDASDGPDGRDGDSPTLSLSPPPDAGIDAAEIELAMEILNADGIGFEDITDADRCRCGAVVDYFTPNGNAYCLSCGPPGGGAE